MRKAAGIPPSIELRPIDDDARDGRAQAVFGMGEFALVIWRGGEWRFPSGAALEFEPTHYQHRERGL